jgi:hypothetical protein
MEKEVEHFLRGLRVDPPCYGMLNFVGLVVLQLLETLYVGKVGVVKPHGGDDHRVQAFF